MCVALKGGTCCAEEQWISQLSFRTCQNAVGLIGLGLAISLDCCDLDGVAAPTVQVTGGTLIAGGVKGLTSALYVVLT